MTGLVLREELLLSSPEERGLPRDVDRLRRPLVPAGVAASVFNLPSELTLMSPVKEPVRRTGPRMAWRCMGAALMSTSSSISSVGCWSRETATSDASERRESSSQSIGEVLIFCLGDLGLESWGGRDDDATVVV